MSDGNYKTNVVTGSALGGMVNAVSNFDKRDCFNSLMKYLKSQCGSRICILYGLRRTGKTTMLQQAIGELPLPECAYLKARTTDTMADMNSDLKALYNAGFRYVFIDEVTLLEDFIGSAALFSDVFAAQGMKIVLSGTDSLGFWLTQSDELYDRAAMIHTTYIPFHEHSRLLKTNDLDEYIRYGGTLRAGETDFEDSALFDDSVSFRDDESARRYIDTAICRNIQNSLLYYDNGGHFRHLRKLYEAGELTNAINRIVEDINHYFLADVLNKKFKSHDLGTSAANLRKAKELDKRTDILDKIDISEVTKRLMEILDIRNKEELSIGITDAHATEIKEYLRALDLIIDLPYEGTTEGGEQEPHTLFTQPGLRFCQAQALVYSLTKDKIFSLANEREKNLAAQRILDEVRGRMTEDIVLLETLKQIGKYRKVFKWQTARSEYDMVIYNSEEHTCEIFEIKHSKQAVPEQYRHLINATENKLLESRFGEIVKRSVLYNGESFTADNGVEYENISEYLSFQPQQTMVFEPEEQQNMEIKFGF